MSHPHLTLTLAVLGALSLAGCKTPDLRGRYKVTWSGRYRVTLDVGGRRHQADASHGDVVRLGGVALDLNELCDREEVLCPHETFAREVRVDQPGWPQTARLRISDAESGRFIDGVIRQDGRFVAGLRGQAQQVGGNCGLLAASAVNGRFVALDDETIGIREGTVTAAIAGLCAGNGLAAGAVLTLSTTYEAELHQE